MSGSSGRPVRQTRLRDVQARVAVFSLLAFAQAVVVGVTGSGVARIVAVVLLLAGLNARLRVLGLLAGLIVINLFVHCIQLPPSLPWRLAHLALFAGYAAVAVASFISITWAVRFVPAFAAACGLAAAVLITDAALPRLVSPLLLSSRYLDGIADREPDAVFGGVYAPYGSFRTEYPDNPRGYFEAAGERDSRFVVSYSLNALGCRGEDYQIPNPHERRRVLLLGGAGTFGTGVREGDTLAVRLQRALAGSRDVQGGAYDVINCAMAGAGTREQRLFYEQIAYRYEPETVVLVMSTRDNLSAFDERRRGFVHDPGRLEAWLNSARVVQWARHEGRRPFEFSGTSQEITQLSSAVRAHGARLAIALFRNEEMNARWNALYSVAATPATTGNAPVRDLGVALLKDHQSSELAVHPLDPHPNETAHRLAAEEIERFLRSEKMID